MIKNFLWLCYAHGYAHKGFPKALRRLFAKTEFHRAWIAGQLGVFTDVETGNRHGVCGEYKKKENGYFPKAGEIDRFITKKN